MVYPLRRLSGLLLRSRRETGMPPDAMVRTPLICWPWDIDIFLEMNNGRHLTLFDLGRFDLATRLGLMGLLRARGWGFVVGGATVQYRRRIRAFQRFEIATRCVARDEKWFYMEQAMWRGGTACSAAMLRVAVVAGPRGTVPSQEVAVALGFPDWRGQLPDWASAWEAADRSRPWPPETGGP